MLCYPDTWCRRKNHSAWEQFSNCEEGRKHVWASAPDSKVEEKMSVKYQWAVLLFQYNEVMPDYYSSPTNVSPTSEKCLTFVFVSQWSARLAEGSIGLFFSLGQMAGKRQTETSAKCVIPSFFQLVSQKDRLKGATADEWNQRLHSIQCLFL